MTSITSLYQEFPPLVLVGLFLGVLGMLYLMYSIIGCRWKTLHSYLFIFSTGWLAANVQLISYIFLIAPQRLADGEPSLNLFSACILGFIGLGVAIVGSSSFPQSQPSGFSYANWLKGIGSMGFSATLLIGLGLTGASPSSNPLVVVLFALPGILILGLCNGFSPKLQWWIFYLPKKYMVVVGALLISGAFALIAMQFLFGF